MSLEQYNSIRAGAVLNPEDPIQEASNGLPAAKEVTRVELVDITEKEKGYGEQSLITLTSSFHQAKEDRGKYSEYALLVRHKVNKDGDATSTDLEVRSPIIRQALQDILSTYAYLNLDADPIIIAKPYDALFHYRTELRAYAKSPKRSYEEKLHMNVLMEFMSKFISPTERLHDQMIPKGMVTFDLLWTLFRAEDDIVVQNDYFKEIKRVVHCEKKTKDDETFFEVQVWRWGYNSGKFGPTNEVLRVPEYSSARRIIHLPFFPVHRLTQSDQDELRTNLVERGRQWRGLVQPEHRQYKGPIWIDPPTELASTMAKLVVEFETSRIMLDYQLHKQSNWMLADHLIGASGLTLGNNKRSDLYREYWASGSIKSFDEWQADRRSSMKKCILNNVQCQEDNDDYHMTDEEAWLCPARARGFSLTSKRFAFFLVEHIKPVEFRADAFNLLEMDSLTKNTIRALVEMHDSPQSTFDDFVAGKGKGVIMSLEGPPGSGKTLTAESIAELTHKPLYVIGAGELGSSSAMSAEPTLRSIFQRAEHWSAVLLLDEADLFLSKRTKDDMERNAYVTIFLRSLEYYQGILFLTTNLVEDYDPAFASRIHLKVPFKAPDSHTRATIWKNLLRSVADCDGWDDAVYDRLGADLDLNGREIKNLIRPALAVAGWNKQPLTEEALRLLYRLNHRKRHQQQGQGERLAEGDVVKTAGRLELVDAPTTTGVLSGPEGSMKREDGCTARSRRDSGVAVQPVAVEA